MKIDVDFKYNEPVIATVYDDYGNLFMKSEVKVNIPKRPHYEPDSKSSCTEVSYLKWKDKVTDKISSKVIEALPEGLYGTINVFVNMEKHHGL